MLGRPQEIRRINQAASSMANRVRSFLRICIAMCINPAK